MRPPTERLPETCRRVLAGLAALVLSLVSPSRAPGQSVASNHQQIGAASGLPVPRFVSLKSDRVNLRNGPGTEYPTSWVFRRAGLPVELLQEFEVWRQVRDAEGATGWVLQSMLSGRRTALVLPWEVKAGQPPLQVPLRSAGRETASLVAHVEAGVVANVRSCDGRWCLLNIGEFKGYIEQKKLWGVYDGEVVK
jgi:SH3-like domain-containing protein